MSVPSKKVEGGLGRAFVDLLPMMLLMVLMEFVNIVHLPANDYTAASNSNLLGLLIGNFVYDGPYNIYFILIPSALAIVTASILSPATRKMVPTRFVFSTIVSAVIGYSIGLGLWNTVLHWDCLNPCHFWGMSSVAGGSTGSAFGLVLFVFLLAADRKNQFDPNGLVLVKTLSRRSVAYCSFALSFAILIIFLPDAFIRQTFLVVIVHATSLLSGLIVTCLLILLNLRRKLEVTK